MAIPQFGTATNFGQAEIQANFQKEQDATNKKLRAECIAKGGKWNEATNTCDIDTIAKSIKQDPIQKINEPDIKPKSTDVTNQTPEELMSGKIDIERIKSGMPTIEQEAEQQRAAARNAQLIQMAQQGLLSEAELAAIEQAPIDWGQALTAGAASAIPTALGAAAGGAATGAIVGAAGGPIGAAAGALIGGVGGFITQMWRGTQSNIKAQQRGEIGSATDVLSAARSNMRQLRMIAETDPTKAEEAITSYYQQVALVQAAYRKVQMETQGNLNKFMEDGTDILSDFELFLMPGGYADIQRTRLEQAIMRGAPATPEEIMQIYAEEYESQ